MIIEYKPADLRKIVREYLDKNWNLTYFEDEKGFLIVVYLNDHSALRYYFKRIYIQRDAILFEDVYPFSSGAAGTGLNKKLFRMMNQINAFSTLGRVLVEEGGSISYVSVLKCSLQTPSMRIVDRYFSDTIDHSPLIIAQLSSIFLKNERQAEDQTENQQ